MSVSFEMAALKYWEVDGVQITNFLFLTDSSQFKFIIQDFKFDFDASFKLNDHGTLDPVVKSCHIDFGKSYFYHDNFIFAFFIN